MQPDQPDGWICIHRRGADGQHAARASRARHDRPRQKLPSTRPEDSPGDRADRTYRRILSVLPLARLDRTDVGHVAVLGPHGRRIRESFGAAVKGRDDIPSVR